MRRKWLSLVLAFILVALAFGALPTPQAAAAGITSISIDYYPTYIPTDAANPCSSGGGTPFAVRITVNGTANQAFGAKIRLGTAACTWRPDNSTWTTDSTSYTALTRGTIGAGGSVSMWLYGRANSTATASLTVRARGCDAGYTTCADNVDSPAKAVTLMNMTSSGGWLEETNGFSRAGKAYAVKSGATLVGLYVSEDNGVNEGYPAALAAAAPMAAGYSKVAVPACTTCGYTIESWNLAAPGTSVGQVNTMGDGACPNDVSAGAVTSLDTCTAPTAITLRTLTARAPLSPLAAAPVVGLALAGGWVALRRRRA